MCNYVAILVYQGIIEEVSVFREQGEAAGWLSGLVREFGADNCADSIIWDVVGKSRIDLAFAH